MAKIARQTAAKMSFSKIIKKAIAATLKIIRVKYQVEVLG